MTEASTRLPRPPSNSRLVINTDDFEIAESFFAE